MPLFGPRRDRVRREEVVSMLYTRIVAQSRRPVFYDTLGVADTPEGRFEVLTLHAILVLLRLRSGREGDEALAQMLFDHMFADLDQNLREIGVGDLRVGKQIKAMAQAFFGRLARCVEAVEARDRGLLAETLNRNTFRSAPLPPPLLDAVVDYVFDQWDALRACPIDAFVAGEWAFASPRVGAPAAP
jgi:cytochrome b pre-mRNA-processing protein 3